MSPSFGQPDDEMDDDDWFRHEASFISAATRKWWAEHDKTDHDMKECYLDDEEGDCVLEGGEE